MNAPANFLFHLEMCQDDIVSIQCNNDWQGNQLPGRFQGTPHSNSFFIIKKPCSTLIKTTEKSKKGEEIGKCQEMCQLLHLL